MKMTNGECDLGEVKLGHWLEKVALSLHEHEQLATLTVLEDQIQLAIGLKCVAQLDNVGMADGFFFVYFYFKYIQFPTYPKYCARPWCDPYPFLT